MAATDTSPAGDSASDEKKMMDDLHRFKRSDEIAEIVELFRLKMVIRRLKCDTFERRVDAVEYISDVSRFFTRIANFLGAFGAEYFD